MAVPLWHVLEECCPLEAAHVADVMQLQCASAGDWRGWLRWADAAVGLIPRMHAGGGGVMREWWQGQNEVLLMEDKVWESAEWRIGSNDGEMEGVERSWNMA